MPRRGYNSLHHNVHFSEKSISTHEKSQSLHLKCYRESSELLDMEIRIAAKVDKADQSTFLRISRLFWIIRLSNFWVKLVRAKNDFLGNSYALLLPGVRIMFETRIRKGNLAFTGNITLSLYWIRFR